MVWVKFLVCVIVILFAGMKLARYADIIAEKTGLGRMWIGLVLVAAVTSMPELVTGISAAALVKMPDLTFGTILGSCFFNLSIIALLDIMHRGKPVLSEARQSHILSGWLGVLLLIIVGVSVFIGERLDGAALVWFGLPSILLLAVYLLGARFIFYKERRQRVDTFPEEIPLYEDDTLKTVYFKFALTAVAVIGTGIWLSYVGDEICIECSLSASFVGSLFLAITTSLPELVVAISAVRMGAIDIAVADIFGANMLDLTGLALADIFYTGGPIHFLSRSLVSGVHIYTSVISAVMTLIVILGLRFQLKKKTFGIVSWYGPLLICLYILGAYILFTSGLA